MFFVVHECSELNRVKTYMQKVIELMGSQDAIKPFCQKIFLNLLGSVYVLCWSIAVKCVGIL
jgi:hypothetical protein